MFKQTLLATSVVCMTFLPLDAQAQEPRTRISLQGVDIRVTEVERSIDDIQTQLDTLSSNVDADITTLATNINDLDDQVSVIATSLEALNDLVSDQAIILANIQQQLAEGGGSITGDYTYVNRFSERSINTWYQNDDGLKRITVFASITGSDDTLYIDVRNPETGQSFRVASVGVETRFNNFGGSMSAWVESGFEYRVINSKGQSRLTNWIEMLPASN